MAFTKLTRTKNWVLGSLVTETGSEYLYGFDRDAGLMWLERQGVEYAASDPIWKEAETYIRVSEGATDSNVRRVAPEEDYVVPEHRVDEDMGRPKTVTKSVAAQGEMGMVTAGFEHVGDFEPGAEFDDDEISAQAEMWLQSLEGE